MTDMSLPPSAAAHDDVDDGEFAIRALKIVFFTGFAIVATIMGFVFLPPAGFVLGALIAWKGFEGQVWRHDSFALRALSIVAFSGFATVATIMGFVFLPPAGFVLAAVFVWRGFSALGARPEPRDLAPRAEAGPRPTGNAAFDAYRAETLRRLEEEQASFETFLARLRDAKGKAEFDQFMDDRARRARRDPPAFGD